MTFSLAGILSARNHPRTPRPLVLGLPLISSAPTPPQVVDAILDALSAITRAPDLRPTLDALLIEGFNRLPPAYYRAVLNFEQLVISQGYPLLQ